MKRLLLASLVIGQFGLIPALPSSAQPACPSIPDAPPSKTTRTIRVSKYGFAFKIPANYRTLAHGSSSSQFIAVHNPSSITYLDCLKRNRIATEGIDYVASVSVGPVNGRSLTQIAHDSRGVFRQPEINIRNIKIAGRSGIQYSYSSLGIDHVGFLVLTSDQKNVVSIGSADFNSRKPFDKQVARAVLSSFSFQR